MKWLMLIVAGLVEMGWAVELKYSQGFTKLVPSIFTIMGIIRKFLFFIVSIKEYSLGCSIQLD